MLLLSELWLLPKNRQYGANSGKIVLAMSRGNRRLFDGVQDHDGRTLEVGVHIGDNVQMFKTSQDRMWADDYHTFQLTWSPGTSSNHLYLMNLYLCNIARYVEFSTCTNLKFAGLQRIRLPSKVKENVLNDSTFRLKYIHLVLFQIFRV